MSIVYSLPAQVYEMNYGFLKKDTQGEKSIFDEWDFLKVYDDVLLQSKHYETILAIHYNALKNCSHAIDLACGSGNLISLLINTGQHVTGIDISAKSLSYLQEKIENNSRLTLIKDDVTSMPNLKGNSYDGVSSMIAAHLLDNFENHLKEAYRILCPGGVFVLTARDASGHQEKIVEIVRNSLDDKALFHTMQKSFEILCKKLLLTANNRSHSLLPAGSVAEKLQRTGFKNITFIENNSKGVMYTLTAIK